MRHGAKALQKLTPRAAQIAGDLREVVAVRSPADDATIDDSGSGADTFTISTGTGYTASGTLAAGNVQMHTG